MPIVDDVVKFITDELNIEITEKNKELIMDKFYPNIKDRILWSLEIENETTYGGILTKKHYEKIMTLSPETELNICIEPSKLKEISFKDDIDTLKKHYENDHYYTDEEIEYFDLIHIDELKSIR